MKRVKREKRRTSKREFQGGEGERGESERERERKRARMITTTMTKMTMRDTIAIAHGC